MRTSELGLIARKVSVEVAHWTCVHKISEFDTHLRLSVFLCTYMCIKCVLVTVKVSAFF